MRIELVVITYMVNSIGFKQVASTKNPHCVFYVTFFYLTYNYTHFTGFI